MINKVIKEDISQIIADNDGLTGLFDKTVMITGASGMIGSYFLYTLIELNETFGANIDVIPVVRNINKLSEFVLNNKLVNPIVQDVTKPIMYENDVEYIIHTASPASPELMKNHPIETNFSNTIGTANMLIFAQEHNAEKFLFTSSREVYGQPISNKKYFKEDEIGIVNPLFPRNSYSESKKAAENMCVGFKEEYGLDTKIVRLGHTFGPGMNINHGMVHVEFLKRFLQDKNIILKSDGSSRRTYTYISDSISAMFKVILESKDVVYNVSNDDNETSVKELAEIFVNLDSTNNLQLIYDIDNEEKGFHYDSFKFCILSSEKIIKELNWKPKYSLVDGFKRTIKFFQSRY